MCSISEYRPTEYLRHWVRFWFDDAKRLQAAQAFQALRIERIRAYWAGGNEMQQPQYPQRHDVHCRIGSSGIS